ncbi:MAG: hypothetical protein K5651_02245 [Bacteroidales bacterium]|nr:hypothetical protein [Bacteroidales bacterium]
MIEIVTTTGVSLDLEKDFEIQVEMEQPLLDSEHMPVAYSTQISFPLTQTNQAAFGYVNAMMLEPSVKTLDCVILFAGREIFSGSLVYDGFEDDKLKYLFTENSLVEELDKDIAPQNTESPSLSEMGGLGDKYAMPIISDIKYARNYSCEPDPTGNPYFTQGNFVVKELKFRNVYFGNSDSISFLPSARILSLLPFLDSTTAEQICLELPYLYLLLPYGEGEIVTSSGTRRGQITKELFPDVSIKDVLQSLTSAFSCCVYKDGNRFCLRQSGEIFERTGDNVLFWDDKVADIYSLFREQAKRYSFSLGEEGIEGEDNSCDITKSRFDDLHGDIDNKRVKCTIPGSDGKLYTIYDENKDATLIQGVGGGNLVYIHDAEIVYRNWGVGDNGIAAEDNLEIKSQFKPVHTLPDRYVKHTSTSLFPAVQNMAGGRVPAIEMPNKDEGRGTDMVVGILYGGVLQEYTQNYPQMYLIPQMLYEKYHMSFAQWIGTDRTGVKAELLLTVDDLTDIAMYKRVNFRGRDWMIKKLSLTFRTGSEHFEATGEFISL